jgi:hypothetical protein
MRKPTAHSKRRNRIVVRCRCWGTANPGCVHGRRGLGLGGWKKQALAGLPDVFEIGREQVCQEADAEQDELYKQIG